MIGVYAQDAITWVRGQGHNSYGEPAAAVETAVLARVRWRNRVVRDWRGTEVASAAEVLMDDQPDAGQDKLRIDGEDHVILAVQIVKAFGRVSHYRVLVQ